MSDEHEERAPQRVITTWENICHILDAALRAVAERRGYEMEAEDWAVAGEAAGENILLQLDLQAFAEGLEADLAALPTVDEGPSHRSEFGL